MKHMKRALTVLLALSMVVTGVTVKPNTADAAKKVSLSKKKVTMAKGKTATVTLNNAKKKVKWTSSKKKIVKVVKATGKKKNKVTFKALKVGSSVLTAKYGKKKYKVKVTVKKTVSNIKSISVDKLDHSCVILKLNNKKAVNVSDLKLYMKDYKEGKYNYQPTVKTITTTDQKTYRIYTSAGVYNGDFLKVALKSDTKDIQYKQAMTGSGADLLLKKDATYVEYLYDYFENKIGTTKYSVSKGTLPAGLTINSSRGMIKGIPTAVGTSTVTIKATDELGRTATANLTFHIYDKTSIAAVNYGAEERLDDYVDARLADTSTLTGSYMDSIEIEPVGGSGNYIYTVDNAEVSLSTDTVDAVTNQVTHNPSSYSYLRVPFTLTEGKHTYTVTITDAADATRTTTSVVTVNATKYYNIKGTAKDSNGASLSGNQVYFFDSKAESSSDYVRYHGFSKDSSGYDTWTQSYTARVGSSEATDAVIGNQKGTYATELAAGTYTVKVNSSVDGINYQMTAKVTVGAADAMIDIAAPVRFYSVSAIAQYANANPVVSSYVYFETSARKYEGYSFSVQTDKTGAFIASLPAGKYSAYVIDENNNRQYFGQTITVTNADVALSDFKLPISMSTVTGTAVNGADNSSLAYTSLYFINAEGSQKYVQTDSTGAFTIALGNGAYTVKASINGSLHVVGTVTVADANLADVKLVYTFATEVAGATELTLGTPVTLNSNGANDIYVKVTSTASGYYDLNANCDNASRIRYQIYTAEGRSYGSDYYNGSSMSTGIYLNKDSTYYIKVIPCTYDYDVDDYVQCKGDVKISVVAED